MKYAGRSTDIVTWHYYPQQSRRCGLAVRRAKPNLLLNPCYLDEVQKWEITGGYTGQKRSMVFCTVNRAQISELKQIVSDVNPDAFVVIGNAQQVLGIGFQHVKRR